MLAIVGVCTRAFNKDSLKRESWRVILPLTPGAGL